MVRKEMPGKPTKKPGKFISRFIAFYALFQLLRAVIGFGSGGIGNSIIMVLLFLLLIGLGIGLFAAKMKQSPIERVRGAEDTIRKKTKAAAQQAAKRPEIRFLRGGDVEEDDFAMPSSDRWAAGLIAPILRGEAVAVSPCEDAPASSDLYYSVSSWNHRHFLCPNGKDRLCDSLGDGNRQTYHANASLNDVTTAIDRRVFLRFGYRQDFAEDLDMGARLLRCGYALKLLSSVRTVHGHSRQTGYYFRRSLVGHQTTMERIMHTPVAGTSTLKTVASTAVTGYEQMQQILAQLDAAACDSLDAYAEAWSKAFRKARVESQVTPAQPAAPYRDETLEAGVDLLRPYADLRKPDGWMLDAISSFWNGTMLPFLREKDMPWTSDLQHDVSDALHKHLAVLIGIRLGELPADNPIADRLNQFRKGV